MRWETCFTRRIGNHGVTKTFLEPNATTCNYIVVYQRFKLYGALRIWTDLCFLTCVAPKSRSSGVQMHHWKRMPYLELWAETACETGVDLIHLCWRPCWVWRVCRSTPFSAKLRHCVGSCQKTTGLWRKSRHDGISEYFGWWLRETISIYFIFCTSPKLRWDFELPNHPVIECDWQVNADNMISYASFCPRAVPQLQPVGVKSCWRKDFMCER